MCKLVIIADDLTGANATGVLLARKGYKTGTFLSLDTFTTEQYEDYQVVSINTDSRAVPSPVAYARVSTAARAMKAMGATLFNKRIDSTLRGNVGTEIDAILEVLGEDSMAVVVAAFPSSGRVTIGGYLMVNSIPLEKTDVAKDPKTPVHLSSVPRVIAQQTKYLVGHIALDKVLRSPEAIRDALLEEKAQGKRIVVFDATTDQDLANIAQGVHLSELDVAAIDPGPFTEALASYFLPVAKYQPGQKVLLVVGSVTPLSRQQLKDVEIKFDSFLVQVDPMSLINSEKAAGEISRAALEVINHIDQHQVVGLRTLKDDDDILNLSQIASNLNLMEDEVAARISQGLAKIAKIVLEQSNGMLGALYTSGGDVTVAVCRELGAAGVEVKDEVLPLAAYGRIIGGAYHNTPMVTKGGLVGGPGAISQCVEYLQTKVSNEPYPNY